MTIEQLIQEWKNEDSTVQNLEDLTIEAGYCPSCLSEGFYDNPSKLVVRDGWTLCSEGCDFEFQNDMEFADPRDVEPFDYCDFQGVY